MFKTDPPSDTSPLHTFAYACFSHRWATSRAAGIDPLTCPPASLDTFDPGLLAGHDFLYFALHGLPAQPYWYGDHWETAIGAEHFQDLNLKDTVVFTTACYFDDESPMFEALRACKPRMLVGGGGENLTRRQSLIGAHLLGYILRTTLETGLNPINAFSLAKQTLKLRNLAIPKHTRAKDPRLAEDYLANRQALKFRIWT
jgi:hypothetical protein